MARKKKKLTKAQKKKIALKNLKKAWKANRGRKRSKKKARRNPTRATRKSTKKRRVKSAKKRTRRRSRRSRHSRRNPARVGNVLRMGSCPPKMRWNPEIEELDICTCSECPVHGGAIAPALATRRNPGFSFKQGKVIPHDREFSSMYHQSATRPPKRRFRNPSAMLRADFCQSPWASTW